MTKLAMALAALISVCVAVGQAAGGASPGTPPARGAVLDAATTAKVTALVSFLELNDGQLEGLRLLEPQFEDELFTLVRDSWEKVWQLRRLYRSDHPDETSAETLREQIEALHEQIQSLEASYREQSLALLNSQQIEALATLEAVFGLSQGGEDVVCANLVEAPARCESVPGLAALAWVRSAPHSADWAGGSPPCMANTSRATAALAPCPSTDRIEAAASKEPRARRAWLRPAQAEPSLARGHSLASTCSQCKAADAPGAEIRRDLRELRTSPDAAPDLAGTGPDSAVPRLF